MSTQIQELIAAETKASSIVAEARAGEEHRQTVKKICFVCGFGFGCWHGVTQPAA